MNRALEFVRRNALFVALYVLLVAHWVLFVNFGAHDYHTFDWYLIHQWLDVAKLALTTGRIPYEVSMWTPGSPDAALFGSKYFAMPFLIVSPQVLLLRWMSITGFITLQVVLAMSVGFYSLILWRRRLGLSDFSTVVLILLWTLNGALVGRMGVGHIQLTGYFLIPAYVYALKKLADSTDLHAHWSESVRNALLIAIVIFVVLLQGSVHTVYQMGLLLVLFALVFVRPFKYVLLTIAVFAMLSMYFILPNAAFGTFALTAKTSALRDVFGGYGTLSFHSTFPTGGAAALPKMLQVGQGLEKFPADFANGHRLGIIRQFVLAIAFPFTAFQDSSWEYSVFVGPIGALLMLIGLAAFLRARTSEGKLQISARWKEIVLFGLVVLLSLYEVSRSLFRLVQKVVPVNAIDRLPTRMFLYAFIVLLLAACVGLDQLRVRFRAFNRSSVQYTVVILLLLSLGFNSSRWAFHSTSAVSAIVEQQERLEKPAFDTKILDSVDPRYKSTVNLGFGLSLLSSIGVAGALILLQRRINKRAEPTSPRLARVQGDREL